MREKVRKTRRGGYTMAEMLIVVAILGILAAIAIPSVIRYRRSLKLTELDDNARTIYLAAQNHLAALHSASGGALETGEAVDRGTATVPSEAVPELDAGTTLEYVSTDIEGAEPGWLVLPGSVDGDLTKAGSHYLVEFDPASGVVYGVFYTEDGDGKALTQSVYQDLYSYTDHGKSCRVREGRDAFATSSDGFLVGYYGADGALDLSRLEGEEMPTPKVKLTNNEELVLEFSATAQDGVDTSRIFYSVAATGADQSGNDCAKTLVDKGKFNSGATNTLVLDTLKGGYSKTPSTPAYGGWTAGSAFAGWVGDASIVPGANITLTVTTWYQPDADEGVSALPKTTTVTTNSLFGQRVDGKVEVGYGRHLQNLGAVGLDSAITTAVQVRDIDFEATTPDAAGDQRELWAETYGDRAFTPIENADLKSFNGNGRLIRYLNAVNAGGNAGLFGTFTGSELKDVVLEDAKATGASAGSLAGVVRNAKVDNCRAYILKGPDGKYSTTDRVKGTTYAGGLIGQCVNSTIGNGCFASTVVSGNYVGGLVGQGGNLTVRQCYAAGYLSGDTVGGLCTGNVKIENCYAAGTIFKASTKAAGLVTQANEVKDSYAAVEYVTVPAPEANGEPKVYGVVPAGSPCNNVYYLAQYGVNDAFEVAGVTMVPSSDEMVKAKAETSEPGMLAALTAFKNGPLQKAYPYNHVTRTEEEGGPLAAPYPYPTLGDLPHYGDWLVTVAPPKPKCLIAYYEQFQDGSVDHFNTEYSYIIGGAEKGNLDLTRTEAINADGYAFLSAKKLHNSWDTANLTVTVAGVESKTTTVKGTFLGPLDEDLNLAANGTEPAYYAYAIPSSALDVIPNGVYYVDVTVQATSNIVEYGKEPDQVETTAWINPLFGRSAYNGTKPGSTPSFIHIRSLRQLANMGRFFGEQHYIQDLDIDAQIYMGDLAANWNGPILYRSGLKKNAAGHLTSGGFELWGRDRYSGWGYVTDEWNLPEEYRLIVSPIGTHYSPDGSEKGKTYDEITSFKGSYDGNGRMIRALSIRQHVDGKNTYAGLFYRINSSSTALKNITLEDSDIVGMTGSAANSTGTLVGRVSGGTVENCKVVNCTVAVQGTKAGGHVGGFTGYADNSAFVIDGCSVENCDVAGGTYAYNAGGFVGYIQKQKENSAIRNCTVKNVSVASNHVGKSNEDNLSRRGTAGGFVGCMMENDYGVVENCAVIGTGDFRVSGTTWYSGGFVGVMVDNAIQNCAVRLEDTPGKNYEAQGVSGGKATGGFAGALTGGSITGSYASVKVDGTNAGGFAGEISGGTVSNSYAGGRTKNSRYTASLPNVTGTGQVGGFVGLWKGGSLDTCYTTCAVSGPNDGATDVFANQETATVNSPIPGCYALGTAFAGGTNRGSLTETKVAVTMTALPAEGRTETHVYDTTLKESYPYTPVKDAAGNAIPHYGDWPGNVAPPREFEWEPVPDPMPESNMAFVQNVEARWVGEELTVTIETIGTGTTLANIFSDDGGTFAITSDLGYSRALDVTDAGNGKFTISDGNGNTWTVQPVESTNKDGELIRSYTFTLPSSLVPTYEKSIGIGGFQHGTMLDGIENDDPDATTNKPTKPFVPGDSVVIDGNFSDWTGYKHQPLAYGGTAAAANTAIGAAFGDDTTIYFHVRNAYTRVPSANLPYTGTLNGLPLFQGIGLFVGNPSWGWDMDHLGTFPSLLNQTYTGPKIYKWTRTAADGTTEVLGQAYIKIEDDGTQEIEMVMYLHKFAGQEEADKIDNFTVQFTTIGGSTLTIHRDLSKKQQ